MFLYKAGIVLLLLLCSVLSYGQHTVKGRVVDINSMESVYGAKIVFNGNDALVTTSRADGSFEFTAAVALTSLNCSAEGYSPFTIDLKRRKVAILIELIPVDGGHKVADTLQAPFKID